MASIIDTLKEKKGPLPLWGWAAVGGGAAFILLKLRKKSAPPDSTYATNDPGGLPLGSGGGGGGGGGTTVPGDPVQAPGDGGTLPGPVLSLPIVQGNNGSPALPTIGTVANYTPPSVNPMQLAPGVTAAQAAPFASMLQTYQFPGAQIGAALDNVLGYNQQGNLVLQSRSAPGIPVQGPGQTTTYFRPTAGNAAASVAAPVSYGQPGGGTYNLALAQATYGPGTTIASLNDTQRNQLRSMPGGYHG